MSKKCIACGAELEDNALFCDECGVEQKEILKSNNEQVRDVTRDNAKDFAEKKELQTKPATSKEWSLRGLISLVLGVVSIFTKNSTCAIFGIILAVTVMIAKNRKKGSAICGLLISVLALVIFIPNAGNDVVVDEVNKENGLIDTINKSIASMDQMVYDTPIDLFIENTSAFDIYGEIELEKAGSIYKYSKSYEGFEGECTVDFYGAEFMPSDMQVIYAEWSSINEYRDRKDCKELLEKMLKNLENRYGEYKDTSNSDINEIEYTWFLDGRTIAVGMINRSKGYVWVSISYEQDYYTNGDNIAIPYYPMEDPLAEESFLDVWVGNYVNENGDIMSIDFSYATEENGYGTDALDIKLSNGKDDMLNFTTWYNSGEQILLYPGEEEFVYLTISSDFERISLVQSGHLSHDYRGVYTRKDSSSQVTCEMEFDSILNDYSNASALAEQFEKLGHKVSFSEEEGKIKYFIRDGAVTWYDGENGMELYLSGEKYDDFSVYGISTKMSYDEIVETLTQAGAQPLGEGLTMDYMREICIDEEINHTSGYWYIKIGIKNWKMEEPELEIESIDEYHVDGPFNFNYTIDDAAEILSADGFSVENTIVDGYQEYSVNNGALRWYWQDGKDILYIEDIGATTFYLWGISPKMTYEDACEQIESLEVEDLGYFEDEGCRKYQDWLYEISIYPKDEGGISIKLIK